MTTSEVAARPFVRILHAVKTYGSTRALNGVTLDILAGEVLGIVGHNGAGKSTLMRMLSGFETCTSGSVHIGEASKPGRLGFAGVRMAYQEGTLALELTVKENVYLSSQRWMPRWRWHGVAATRAVDRLSEIFPDHGISALDHVDDLPLADRQTLEIARATITDDLRLLILDEPTESLSGAAVDQLYDYVRRLRSQGCAVVLVSHRLREILSVSDRVAVMKDGAVVSTHRAADLTERDLFMAMGGDIVPHTQSEDQSTGNQAPEAPVVLRIPMKSVNGVPTQIVARRGEVIGLAGIAGQGQGEVLERIWQARRGDVEAHGKRAYVPGDRQKSGIFPLWTVSRNLTISSLGQFVRRGLRQFDKEAALVTSWVVRLKVRGGAQAAIVGLSGGNQQKVIVARAFASDAETILLDDPFRGVDVHTKAELYQLIREEVARGKTIIWYSSENSEMQYCDRAYVLRANRIAGELTGRQITDDRIIALSFAEKSVSAI